MSNIVEITSTQIKKVSKNQCLFNHIFLIPRFIFYHILCKQFHDYICVLICIPLSLRNKI
jgi:hypothetical protein